MQQNAERRKRYKENRDNLRLAGWRDANKNGECFVRDNPNPSNMFPIFILRGPRTLFQIFNHFVTDELIRKILSDFKDKDFELGGTTRHGNPRLACFSISDVWQALAVQVYIVGVQKRSTENEKNDSPLKTSIKNALLFFANLNRTKKVIGVPKVLKLTSIINFHYYERELCNNFQCFLCKLGDSVAGDEKLFHFTGESGNIRLVLSKPDRVGLWFYQLCCKLSCGKPYLLYARLQQVERLESITCKEIVGEWCDVIASIGNPTNNIIDSPNKHTFLAFDSYYMSNDVRQMLSEKNINYTASCCKTRFGPEVNALHNDTADSPGETKTMYNETTNEIFTYHYDTQKGVGKKYNLTRGLIRKTDKRIVRSNYDLIPGYDLYKVIFECC